MALNENIKILEDSLQKARKYNEEKNYGRSFAHYLVVFQLLKAESRLEYEKEFTNVLYIWGSILHKRKKYEDIFKCYHLATLYFPLSTEILNNLGVHALKLKHFNIAKSYFEQSLNNNPNFLPAEQNLQTTKFMLVERWHFPMLNDVRRNKSYGQAIFMEIANGFRDVLDVGTGTGILSLFAAKSEQTKTIVACDYSEPMYEIATKVFRANNATGIKLIKKSSCDLVVPRDLQKRASLLVTEILDSGIFGENILETLIHAWDHLLFSVPYAKVIPSAVAVYVAGIQSDTLARKVRPQFQNHPLNFHQLCLVYLPLPYDTENLHFENVTYVTDTQLALHVNFNSVQQLKLLLSEHSASTIKLNIVKTGRIDAFVVWFKLFLNDLVSITNDPRAATTATDSCWEQAIFYLHHPMTVQTEQELNIQMSCAKGYIDIIYNEVFQEHTNCFLLPKNAILFLNDSILMKHIETISQLLLHRFLDNVSVLDLSPFPVLGLLLLVSLKTGELTCKITDDHMTQVVWQLCEINAIDRTKITILPKDHEFKINEKQFDVVYQNFINPCGLLNEEEVYNSQILKLNLSNRGVYIPANVVVCAQLVACDWLERATKVADRNVCDFKIAEFINEYKSTEQRDIHLDTMSHTKLTDVVQLGYVQFENTTDVDYTKVKVTFIQDGCANAIFYWFKIELMEGVGMSMRRPDAYTNNASFMLDAPLVCNTGATVCLILKQHRGILKIYVEK